jgi:hypothetical protein
MALGSHSKEMVTKESEKTDKIRVLVTRQMNRGLYDATVLTCHSQNVQNATFYRTQNVTVSHFNQKAHSSTSEPCRRTACIIRIAEMESHLHIFLLICILSNY